jgi:nicotinamidase-related amidase
MSTIWLSPPERTTAEVESMSEARASRVLQHAVAADESLLIVVDVQPTFLNKLAATERQGLLQRIGRLVSVARWLGIPIVATAEDVARAGGLHPRVAAALPPDTIVHDKLDFDLAADGDIAAAIDAARRRTAVLVGLETDVCVAQSALGLLKRGYDVVVVGDATGAPESGHAVGLERVRRAGALVTSVNALYCEWTRTVDVARQCDDDLRKQARGGPTVAGRGLS